MNFREQGARALIPAMAAHGRCRDSIERPGPHRLKYFGRISFNRSGNHQDGTGGLGHDTADDVDSARHLHEQIHENKVRRIHRTTGHGFGAISGHPDDLMIFNRGQGLPYGLDCQFAAIGNTDSHAASPTKSTTACKSVLSWNLLLLNT